MRITDTNRVGRVASGTSARRRGSGSAFHLDEADEPKAATGAFSGQPVHGIDALIALQGVDDALTGRRKAIRHGHDLLDQLEGLRLDLLSGQVSAERLHAMLTMVESRPESNDPQIGALIDEIELRARVELAKLGHYAG